MILLHKHVYITWGCTESAKPLLSAITKVIIDFKTVAKKVLTPNTNAQSSLDKELAIWKLKQSLKLPLQCLLVAINKNRSTFNIPQPDTIKVPLKWTAQILLFSGPSFLLLAPPSYRAPGPSYRSSTARSFLWGHCVHSDAEPQPGPTLSHPWLADWHLLTATGANAPLPCLRQSVGVSRTA